MSVHFDPYSREFFADPYPIYKRLRDEVPVVHNPELRFWALSRFEDVLAAHRDVKRFLSSGGVSIEGAEAKMPFLIVKDGAEHIWHKSLVTKVFTPKKMAALEPFIRGRARELLEKARAEGR